MSGRHCLRCGGDITACMGFVLARDMLLAMDGLITWRQVREHCGVCREWLMALTPRRQKKYFKRIPNLEPVQ